MSRYIRNLLPFDQGTLDRPDIGPWLHPRWLPEAVPNEIGRPTCVLSGGINVGRICSPTDTNTPRIRRRDLEDFRRIWLQNNYGNTNNPSLLRGYWEIDNWEQIGRGSIVVVQYRTLRVCLRGGSGTVMIGTADIDNILGLCLSVNRGDEMPQCMGSLLYSNRDLQWLLLPVELAGPRGLVAYVGEFRAKIARARAQHREATRTQILAVLLLFGDFRRFEDFLQRHRIDWTEVPNPEVDGIPLPEGYEALLDEELEQLFRLAGTPAHPDPLPLTADERAEQIIVLQTQTMNLVRQREASEANELNTLRRRLTPHILEARRAAVDRCMALRIYHAPSMPRSVEDNQQTVQQLWDEHLPSRASDPREYSSYFRGPDSSGSEEVRRQLATDAIDSCLDSLQASTISGGYDESSSDDDQAYADY